ncbi:MAG: hypothetical protein ACTSRK_14350 [Promethearchaeota archaeon]
MANDNAIFNAAIKMANEAIVLDRDKKSGIRNTTLQLTSIYLPAKPFTISQNFVKTPN